jgi:hypothetical protein
MPGKRFSIIYCLFLLSCCIHVVDVKLSEAAEALSISHLSVTVPDLKAKWIMEDPVIALVESVDGLKSDEIALFTRD